MTVSGDKTEISFSFDPEKEDFESNGKKMEINF